ncbi:low temperature requirement protein A [Streptomyces sp. NBC_01017]|uniref:low temperature requirement protein A n=1 Tax=Streptomyces sp. NBC_01017 TaxID=2903721 RepID=UPI00386598AC|nr:low temperature requirement protein A [Streptomyces sp. NBC_01017]WSV34906.1 low temperature requirement protein A [Streptomyces sp. NBC_01017]
MATISEAPQSATPDQRHADWLELFFDLVFVALAAQLSHSLHGDPSLRDFAILLALYFPPWWMWINFTVSANLFEDDSARRRLLLLSAMACLAVMAAAVPDVAGERGPMYALGYAGTRFVLLGLWWPATRLSAPVRVPKWRPLSYCLVSGVLWAVSAFTPEPWRYVLWALLIVAEVALLITARGLPGQLHKKHLVERVGLFVIIVLGESVFTLVTSTDHAWTARAGLTALLGFVLLAALWWSYFDFGVASAERTLDAAQGRQAYLLVRDTAGFLHFFVTASVICIAGGLATTVHEAGHHHLPEGAVIALAGGLALYHFTLACIALRYRSPLGRVATWAVPGVGIPVLVILLANYLSPWLVVLILATEAIAHLLYAKAMTRHRPVAGMP